MDDSLLKKYFDAGLIQFGLFRQTNGAYSPFLFSLAYLPSYPELLAETATRLCQIITSRPQKPDYLLATAESLAVASISAVECGLPLLWMDDKQIVGAYDTGHPTALITNRCNGIDALLVKRASAVGLQLIGEVSLTGHDATNALFAYKDIVAAAQAHRYIPSEFAATALEALAQRREVSD